MNDRYRSSLISILLFLLCAITTQVVEAGYLFTAGSNSSQQLGHSGSELGRVQGDLLFQNVSAVDAGENFSLAILNGKVYSWGTHLYALGVNSTFTSTNVPTLLKGSLTGRVATVVRACQNHALAVDSLGKVHAWGLNTHYNLGTGNTVTTYSPTMVTFSSNVSDVCCGTDYTVALTTTGAVYTWGLQIGGGADITIPTAKGLTGITKITCGRAHAAALTNGGVLYTWGENTKNQLGKLDALGLGLTNSFVHNALSVAGKTVVDIASGGDNGYAVTADGSLYSWGDDSQGQLGLAGLLALGTPQLVTTGVTNVFISNFKTTALIRNTLNNVLSIGSGLLGLLGLGGGSNSPVALPSLLPQSTFSKISLGASHSLFLLSGTTCNLLFNGEVGVCSGRGNCSQIDSCECPLEQFTGWNCHLPVCFGLASDSLSVCSLNGNCSDPNSCICNPLWGGSNCSLPLCGGLLGDHLNVCGGRGNCLLPDLCDCSSGFGGLLCELTDCFGFLSNDSLNVCSSHGQCIAPNLCLCSDDHEGPLCDILKTFTIGLHGLNELDSVCGGLNVTASISSVSLFSLVSISWSVRQNGISTPLTQTSGYSLNVLPELGAGEFTLVATVTANISGLVLEKTAELKLHFDCGLPPLCFLQESISNCSYHIGFADNGNSIIPGVKHLFSRHRPLTLVPSIVNNLGQLVLDKLGFSFDWAVGSSALNSNLLTINGFNQSELVLNPVSAVEGMGDLTVNITLTITTPLGGVATIPFILKSRPYIPMVTVPNNCLTASLTSLSDFRISANNWGSGLVFYYFSYYYNDTKVTIKSSTNSTVSASLPAGQQRNSTLGLIVSVIESTANDDRLGACSFNLTIPALLPNITVITDGVKNILDKVTNLTQVVEGPISNVIANILEDTITSINQIQGNVTVELLKDYLTITNVILNHQSVMNETSIMTALKIVHAVLKAATSTSTISTPIFHEQEAQMVVTILSNVSTHEYRTSESLGDELMDTVKAMVTLMLSSMSVGDAPMILTSQLLEVIIGLDNCSNLALAPVKLPHKSSSFLIPNSFSDNVNSDVVAYSMVVFKNNPYAWGSVNDTNRMSSPVLDLTFRYHNGPDMHVAELSEPIILQLQCSSGSCEDKKYDCGYWDEVQKLWKTDGCYMLKSDAQSIYCACNHTTSFSAFILETGDTTVKYMEIKIAGIAINTVYIVICSAILVGLVLTYNTQPVRSRFIAPHLGMIAIIVDSVLQGWIRNSLSLAGQHVASDAFSYVIMLSANPLTVVMLFVFLWQQIRFILHQNIYHIMGSTSPKQRQHFMRISRIIVSKWVFSIVALVVGLCVLAVFAILVGLAAGLYNKGTSTTNRTKIVTVQALVYAGMMVFLALAILATMIIDYLGSMKRALIDERNSRLGTTQEPNAFKKERSIQGLLRFPIKFFSDDVLWFRTEACFIFVAICLLIATYSVGIASLVVESKTYSPLDIIRTVLEFTHIFVKIAAFGGAVLVFSIIGVFRRGTSCISPTGYNTNSTASESDAIMGEMLTLLRHEHGYYVAFRYFQLESSLENLLLWKDLEQLKTNGPIMSASQRKSALDAIHDLYLKKNSEREFNISGARKKSFIQKIEPAELSLEEFEKAIRILYSMAMDNIGDTFSRFISTREYAGFLASRRISRELAEISTTN